MLKQRYICYALVLLCSCSVKKSLTSTEQLKSSYKDSVILKSSDSIIYQSALETDSSIIIEEETVQFTYDTLNRVVQQITKRRINSKKLKSTFAEAKLHTTDLYRETIAKEDLNVKITEAVDIESPSMYVTLVNYFSRLLLALGIISGCAMLFMIIFKRVKKS